jgi:hypothetical protein
MNDLLQIAVKAHGGLKRWNQVKAIKVAASITGAIWFVKSKGDYLKDIVMTIDTTKERLITDFPGQDKRSIFESERIVMEKEDGTLIEARDDPEAFRRPTARDAVGRFSRRTFPGRSLVDLPEHSLPLHA